MLLLTGATGTRGLRAAAPADRRGEPVRCLVRDPRRLGPERVRVQIALGDLADPPSFRNALRGVRTVVHLAASIRDQPARLDRGAQRHRDVAAWSQAAERAGVERFIFFCALGASPHNRGALPARQGARRARRSRLGAARTRLRAVDRLRARRPLPDAARAPRAAAGHAGERPRAGALPADLGRGRRRLRAWPRSTRRANGGTRATSSPGRTTLTPRARSSSSRCARAAAGARPVHVADALAAPRACARSRRSPGPAALATWDEAELLEVPMLARARDGRRRGARRQPGADVRGAAPAARRSPASAGRRSAHGCAASSCARERQQRASLRGRPTSWTRDAAGRRRRCRAGP